MQFITTDQRIAVENFDLGLIYTVTFTDGRYFIGACIGIGKDYVMFQHTAPELIYCLNLTTAADVANIEPLPENIGQILEYTGTVPTTIKTDGSPLLDYLITGNTVQNGTPTPSAPVPVVGVGELDSGQYKIPILSADTTTPIYLGETQTTRRIKKLVLTGEESAWSGTDTQYWQLLLTDTAVYNGGSFCSHFSDVRFQSTGERIRFYVDKTVYETVTVWKTYLAQQYAAGTPVCVWYVLATEETGIVNEPLMKIGTYADTLSYRQSGVNIPTADGLNIFDISTTLKPSEVYFKYFSPIF